MGLPAYLVRGTVTLVIAQRLVRRLCAECRSERAILEPEATVFAEGGLAAPCRVPIARGCTACVMQGYRGRLAVFEVHEVRARDSGGEGPREMTLLRHGLDKVVAGDTTLEEVLAECPAARH